MAGGFGFDDLRMYTMRKKDRYELVSAVSERCKIYRYLFLTSRLTLQISIVLWKCVARDCFLVVLF